MDEEQISRWQASRNSLGLDAEGANRFPRWVLDSRSQNLGVQIAGTGSQELRSNADWVTFSWQGDDGKVLWMARPLDGAARAERGNLDDWRGAEFGAEKLGEPRRRLQEFKADGLADGMTETDCACPALLVHDVFDALAAAECYAADFGDTMEVWPMCLAGSVQEVAERLKAASVTRILVLDAKERNAFLRAGLDSELVAFESGNDLWRAMQDEKERECFVTSVCKAANKFGMDSEGVTLEEADRAFCVFEDWQEPMPTGFRALDNVLNGGFAAGRVYLLAAAPSTGKTLFTLQVATQVAESGANVAYFSTEMSSGELYARMVSRRVHMDICSEHRAFNGHEGQDALTAYEAARLSLSKLGYLEAQRMDAQGGKFSWSSVLGSGVTEAALLSRSRFDKVKEGPLADRIADARRELLALKGRIRFFENEAEGGMTLGTIERVVRGLVARFGRRWLIVVDYMGMLQTDDRRMTDAQRAASISLGLKCLARKMQVPVLAVSATSRSNYGQTGMSTARDSGLVEYCADVLVNVNFLRVVQKDDPGSAKGKATKETDTEAYRRRDRIARRLDDSTHARTLTVDVAKNRNGRTSIYVEFMQWPQFSDMLELGLRETDY